MNGKLVAGLAAVGILAGGGAAAGLAAASGNASATSRTAAATATPGTTYPSSVLAPLVSNGTITQAQATTIQNAMAGYMRDHWRDMADHWGNMRGHWRDMADHMNDMHGYMRGWDSGYPQGTPGAWWAHGPMQAVLQQLVSKGAITQAQATSISRAMIQHMSRYMGLYGGNTRGEYGPHGWMMGWGN